MSLEKIERSSLLWLKGMVKTRKVSETFIFMLRGTSAIHLARDILSHYDM